MRSVCALLLAAGESKRMGRLKPLLPWQGTSLLKYQVSMLLQSDLDPVSVVLGHQSQKLLRQLPNTPKLKVLYNPEYRKGKTTSLKLGFKNILNSAVDAILILNVDQPRTIGTINTILNAYNKYSPLITIPTYQNKSGHPIILSCSLLYELMHITEETLGLRDVINKYSNCVHRVPMETDEIIHDLNSEQDYQRALQIFGGEYPFIK